MNIVRRYRRLMVFIALLFTVALCIKVITVSNLDVEIFFGDLHVQVKLGDKRADRAGRAACLWPPALPPPISFAQQTFLPFDRR